MHSETFVIARLWEPGLFARVTVATALERKAVKDALIRALSSWFRSTPQGKQSWVVSSRNYNIGDLASDYDEPTLQPLLHAEGIDSLRVDVIQPGQDHERDWRYDDVLIDEDAEEDD